MAKLIKLRPSSTTHRKGSTIGNEMCVVCVPGNASYQVTNITSYEKRKDICEESFCVISGFGETPEPVDGGTGSGSEGGSCFGPFLRVCLQMAAEAPNVGVQMETH